VTDEGISDLSEGIKALSLLQEIKFDFMK